LRQQLHLAAGQEEIGVGDVLAKGQAGQIGADDGDRAHRQHDDQRKGHGQAHPEGIECFHHRLLKTIRRWRRLAQMKGKETEDWGARLNIDGQGNMVDLSVLLFLSVFICVICG
jgi:hypothetical protein